MFVLRLLVDGRRFHERNAIAQVFRGVRSIQAVLRNYFFD